MSKAECDIPARAVDGALAQTLSMGFAVSLPIEVPRNRLMRSPYLHCSITYTGPAALPPHRLWSPHSATTASS